MARAAHALRIEGDRLSVPTTAFEHAGFRTWVTGGGLPDAVRATWVAEEVLVEMSPEEIESHAKVKGAVFAALHRIVQEEDLGELLPDNVLVTNAEAGVSTEPDVTFVSWESLESRRVRLVEKSGRTDRFVEIEGSPDLVIEVVSESSVRKDTRLLREAYLKAGVREYWLIDARGEAVLFEILWSEGDAFRASAGAGEPQRSRVFARAFTLSRSRNRVGLLAYRLEIAPS